MKSYRLPLLFAQVQLALSIMQYYKDPAYDDGMPWKHFLYYWHFMRRINQSKKDSHTRLVHRMTSCKSLLILACIQLLLWKVMVTWSSWIWSHGKWGLWLIPLRLRENGRHFPDDNLKCIFLNEKVWISIKISLEFVPKGRINNIPVLVQIMAWCRPGYKPLSETMLASLLMHTCVTRASMS